MTFVAAIQSLPLLADNGVLIERTLFSGDNGNNAITDNGAAILLTADDTTSWAVGFVFRRRQLSEDISGGFADENFLLMHNGVHAMLENDLVPGSDLDWHRAYVLYDFDMSRSNAERAQWAVYIDGLLTRTYSSGAGGMTLAIGSRIDLNANEKSPTLWNGIVDDVTVWRTRTANVVAQLNKIVQFGAENVSFASDPELLAYYNCEAANSAPPVYTEGTVVTTSAAVSQTVYTAAVATPEFGAADKVFVNIETDFGADLVSPKVSERGAFDVGIPQVFTAPPFIYLDRYYNELGTNLTEAGEKVHYRATLDGYSLDGGDTVTNASSITETLDGDFSIKWFWIIDHVVNVDFDIESSSLSDAELGASPGVGITFHSNNAAVTPQIKGSITSSETEAGDIEFQIEGYTVENDPTETDRYLLLSSGNDNVHTDSLDAAALSDWSQQQAITFEYWVKLERTEDITGVTANDANHVIANMGQEDTSSDRVRIMFGPAIEGYPARIQLTREAGGFEQYDLPGTNADEQWHHWAWVLDTVADTLRVYRDAELIHEVTTLNFFPSTLKTLTFGKQLDTGNIGSGVFRGGINNFRIWYEALDPDQVESVMTTNTYDARTTADLALEVSFDDADLTTVTGTHAAGIFTGTLNHFDNLFGSTASDERKQDAIFPEVTQVVIETAPEIQSLGQRFLQDWLLIKWRLNKRYKLTIDTLDASGATDYNPDSQPFISGDVTLEGSGSLWVPDQARVTVGTRFRTTDRNYTFNNIIGGSGTDALAVVTDDALIDGSFDGRVTREFEIVALNGPGTITFAFDRTIFRAVLPLGEGLSVASATESNARLVPDLPDGAGLKGIDNGPENFAANAFESGGSGDAAVWDLVGQQLLPLWPGILDYNWADANDPEREYHIQIVSGFPTENLIEQIPFDVEDENGNRFPDGSGGYLSEVTFDSVSDAFPASPAAHYRHLTASTSDNAPPVEFDADPADRWYFVRQTFTRSASAIDDFGRFTATATGKSLQLFSYTLDPEGVAVGDVTTEAFAARIVDSGAIRDHSIILDNMSDKPEEDMDARRKMFSANEQTGIYAQQVSTGSQYAIGSDLARTHEFWARLNPIVSDPAADRIAWEIDAETAELGVSYGFRGPGIETNPNGFFVDFRSAILQESFDGGSFSAAATLADDAYVDASGFLVLTEDVDNQKGSFIIEDINNNQPITELRVSFKIRMDRPGGGTRADGLAFSFGPDIPDTGMADGGGGSGLRVAFRVFNQSNGPDKERFQMWYGSTVIAETVVGDFADIDDMDTDEGFVPVSIHLRSDGLIDVVWDGITVHDDLQTGFTGATGWRLAWSARTGGHNQVHQIDELEIDFSPAVVFHSTPVIETAGLVIDNNWHHYAVTYAPDEAVRIFFDGRLVEESAFPVPVSAQSGSNRHRLGYSSFTGGNWLNGDLDNVAIWDTAGSAADIRAGIVGSRSGGSLLVSSSLDQPLLTSSQVSNTGSGVLRFFDRDGNNAAADSALVDQDTDFFAEVASRITSKLDTAGLASGYLINAVSNYNPLIYNRSAGIGEWDGIFPVNWSGLFTDQDRRLRSAWYENPGTLEGSVADPLHPNVNWPYVVIDYDAVGFPTRSANRDRRIYIASRLGTEGVSSDGVDQQVFDPAKFDELAIYNQPDFDSAGYNPNEEHALIALSIKDQLTGDNRFNLGQDAAFALQTDLNLWGAVDSDAATTANNAAEFTSEPWVLVQYFDFAAKVWEMAAYRVEQTRTEDGAGNTIAAASLFPALDGTTHNPVDSNGVPVSQPTEPRYDFVYPTFAGNILTQPYPLNRVVGNLVMSQDSGANITGTDGIAWRTVWKDKNSNAWVVSGGGRQFFYRYWYPFRDDFWFDTNGDRASDLEAGTAVAWLPESETFLETDSDTVPQRILYNAYWEDDYPILKRGETLTYAGGEFASENSAAAGLPAVVAMAAAHVVFDSATPDMDFDTIAQFDDANVRMIRPLDRLEADIAAADMPEDLTPANAENVLVDGDRWYFKGLTGSLQKRLYLDSLQGRLVFRGRLNDLESGDGNLTATPVSLYTLEANVMTPVDYAAAKALAPTHTTWTSAVDSLYLQAQNPAGVLGGDGQLFTTNPASLDNPGYYAGFENVDLSGNEFASIDEIAVRFAECTDIPITSTQEARECLGLEVLDLKYRHLDSLGVGSALVPNHRMLTSDAAIPKYVTIAENNHAHSTGAVSLHVIEIGSERYRGGIKMIEARDVFDEKINIRHTGDFGGNTAEIYYQWWVRDVANLDDVGLPGEDLEWQIYQESLNLQQIEFTARPDVMLADKLFYLRYGTRDELQSIGDSGNVLSADPDVAVTTAASWRLVDINDDSDSYARSDGDPVPYQWAGAANSPQTQADGSQRFLPQLVMGWVKRVLDRINPYEARFTDFYNNESPGTYSSQIQIAGPPYIGNVALNSDRDVIENVGLIELYETVLDRARSLSLDVTGAATPATNQTLLLAATRLSFLYDLLAREAYSDAQDPTVTVTAVNGLNSVASYIYAFYNQEASLLHEELALLRGSDFRKSYPVFNRVFWNYVKGEGEAAYNANYNIQDADEDGFINESDAAELYPQGHGDAWGHFISAGKMHYELLRHSAFDWQASAELYGLLDNVIEVDYLDEKSFSRTAAAKARAGSEIVTATYRLAYTEDPDGQWQGYTDADQARAWGVSDWAKRAGQAAYFDWLVAESIVPGPDPDAENLDRIDRRVNTSELDEIALGLMSIQTALDQANAGFNPVGLDQDAMSFDMDPFFDGRVWQRATHFSQVYERAVQAGRNALAALEIAGKAENDLRRIADDTRALQVDALRQDLDYRNRLIEIFGTPYQGTIGAGKTFNEGYSGPDTVLYLYIDETDPDSLLPDTHSSYTTLINTGLSDILSNRNQVEFRLILNSGFSEEQRELFREFYLTADFDEPNDVVANIDINFTGDHAFVASEDWGRRVTEGRIQQFLNAMLREEIDLKRKIADYDAFVNQALVLAERLDEKLKIEGARDRVGENFSAGISSLIALAGTLSFVQSVADSHQEITGDALDVIVTALPDIAGLAIDPTSGPEAAAKATALSIKQVSSWASSIASAANRIVTELLVPGLQAAVVADASELENLHQVQGLAAELSLHLTGEEAKRREISLTVQSIRQKELAFRGAVAEGFRLLAEREAFNMVLASKAQRNRYADMIRRIARNESVSQYRNALDTAVRYAWLAAKAYDYETGFSENHPAAAAGMLEQLVRTRTLGSWQDGEPRIGQKGLAGILARLKANFDALEGQLGINNPQYETGKISLRRELYRIATDTTSSDRRWKRALWAGYVDDLHTNREFTQYCRPFAAADTGPQPGLVLSFATEITSGRNIFGRHLLAGDHAYSSSRYATKIRSVGLWFENYSGAALASAPRAYLVPVGSDVMLLSDSDEPRKRSWNILEQRIPPPFVLSPADFTSTDFIPSLHSINGSFAQIRRFADFRAYNDSGGSGFDSAQLVTDSRLIGRSVWNTGWLLIIPGISLHGDADFGLREFIDNVSDIRLIFETYSHAGI